VRPPPLETSTRQYERPNQPWLCGLSADGHACALGPTQNGRCPALAECAPFRDGDRWLCNRTSLRGGPCEAGPAPDGACSCVPHCTPVLSLREKRGRFVAACALATGAALVLVLSADWRNDVIAPGPLTTQHAQLLRREGQPPECTACHTAADDKPIVWTAGLLTGRGDEPTQSQLCMKCHARTLDGRFAMQAHNVPPDVLEQVRQGDKETRRQGETQIRPVSRSPGLPVFRSSSIACSTCHREHHGASFDLTAINNAACQACHQQRYDSFATDHPDFSAWPYTRRTPIVFNHASHLAKHYPEKDRPAFDCRQCHTPDHSGAAQLTASYEQTCAACHDEKIATSATRGVPMFVLPTLDVAALRNAGHDIGTWPKAATGDFDGRLPPVMNLLLAADPAAAQALAKFGDGFEFLDVDPDDKDQLAACATLATAIKKLLAELIESRIAAARSRLKAALGREITEHEFRDLFAGLSTDTLEPAARAWLGQNENAPRQASNPLQIALGTWFYDEPTMSIRYRPAGHADPVLTGWLTQIAATSAARQKSHAQRALQELAKPTAPGLCASCHSLESTPSGSLTIRWFAVDRASAPRPFTKFNHGPHLLLRDLADCTSCHAIDEKADTSSSYANWLPSTHASEFKTISKGQCASCHTAKAAGDQCQKCHNYHVQPLTTHLRPLISLKTSTDTPPAPR
jgi:hypothetical protein